MEIQGTIKVIMDTQTFDSGFTKREMVLTTKDGEYEQHVKIEFLKDKGDLLEKFGIGEEVKVSINIRGNMFNEKYYVSIQGWKIEGISTPTATQQKPEPTPPEASEVDDLGF